MKGILKKKGVREISSPTAALLGWDFESEKYTENQSVRRRATTMNQRGGLPMDDGLARGALGLVSQ